VPRLGELGSQPNDRLRSSSRSRSWERSSAPRCRWSAFGARPSRSTCATADAARTAGKTRQRLRALIAGLQIAGGARVSAGSALLLRTFQRCTRSVRVRRHRRGDDLDAGAVRPLRRFGGGGLLSDVDRVGCRLPGVSLRWRDGPAAVRRRRRCVSFVPDRRRRPRGISASAGGRDGYFADDADPGHRGASLSTYWASARRGRHHQPARRATIWNDPGGSTVLGSGSCWSHQVRVHNCRRRR
jgi:hypothetical protein